MTADLQRTVRRNTILLAATMAVTSGALQLVAALASTTFVLATGFEGLLGLGPAIFLASAACAALPAGRAMDRLGRIPVIATGFVVGRCGRPRDRASRPARPRGSGVIIGFFLIGSATGTVTLSRARGRRHVSARAPRPRHLATSSAARSSARSSGPSCSARSSPDKGLEPSELVGAVDHGGGPDADRARRSSSSSGPTRRRSRSGSVTATGPTGPGGAAADDSSASGRPDRAPRRGGLLRRHGRGHEPDRIRGRPRAPSRAAGRLPDHRRARLRDVRARPRRRPDRRPGRRHPVARHRPRARVALLSRSHLGRERARDAVLLFGLGLGWNLAFVSATTTLVNCAAPSERGKLVGFSDLSSGLTGAVARAARRLGAPGATACSRSERGRRRSRSCPALVIATKSTWRRPATEPA